MYTNSYIHLHLNIYIWNNLHLHMSYTWVSTYVSISSQLDMEHSSHFLLICKLPRQQWEKWLYHLLSIHLIVQFQYTCITVSEVFIHSPVRNNFISCSKIQMYTAFCLTDLVLKNSFISKGSSALFPLTFSKVVLYICDIIRVCSFFFFFPFSVIFYILSWESPTF